MLSYSDTHFIPFSEDLLCPVLTNWSSAQRHDLTVDKVGEIRKFPNSVLLL